MHLPSPDLSYRRKGQYMESQDKTFRDAVALVREPFKADPALVAQLEQSAQTLIQTILKERKSDEYKVSRTSADLDSSDP